MRIGFQITVMYLLVSCMLAMRVYAGLNDGLVAYYPFNGNANDESRNGNNGTVYGATLATDRAGHPNSAYSFDGVDDYIDIGNKVKPPFPITVSVWIKRSSLDSTASIIRNDFVQSTGGSYYGFQIYSVGGGQIECWYGDGGPSSPSSRRAKVTNDPVITSTDKWYHVLVRYNACQDIDIFVDGEEKAGYWDGGSGGCMQYSTTYPGAIGRQYPNVYTFNGLIDDVRVYNRALTEYEIQQLSSPVSPPNHDFGIKAIGWQAEQQFSLTNMKAENITLGNLSLTGDEASEFIIQNDNCSGFTLAPQEVRTFDVVFTAASLGSKSSIVNIPIISPSITPLDVSLIALVTEICECDLNIDGRCDMRDWLLFGQRWGATNCNTVPCACDLNMDGRCDMRDWLRFGQDWGRTNCPMQ